MKYAAGLDGGGTKTAVTVMDAQGRIVFRFDAGGINFNGQVEGCIRATFREIFAALADLCGGLERIAHVGIGAAGVSNPSVPARMDALVRECGYGGGLTIAGDHETALFGALERENGMILIAGTGSICYGKNEAGMSHRTGGFGHLIDDEGSGYSIARELLSAVVRADDGRAPETVITGMVYERLGIKAVQQIVGFVYDRNRSKKDMAALAPILSEACEAGDPAALRIADRSADALLELVAPVADILALQEGTLAMAGSVLLKNRFVREAFLDKLGRRLPGLTCIPAKQDAAVGAALMALNRIASD